jgi:hypothetical protein
MLWGTTARCDELRLGPGSAGVPAGLLGFVGLLALIDCGRRRPFLSRAARPRWRMRGFVGLSALRACRKAAARNPARCGNTRHAGVAIAPTRLVPESRWEACSACDGCKYRCRLFASCRRWRRSMKGHCGRPSARRLAHPRLRRSGRFGLVDGCTDRILRYS